MVDLPPLPRPRPSTPEERAAHAADMDRLTTEMIERRETRKRYQATRVAHQTSAAKARRVAQDRARKVRRLMVDLDEAQRWAEARRLLGAPPPTVDAAQRKANRLQQQLAANLEKVRELAAGGCEVSRALLQEVSE